MYNNSICRPANWDDIQINRKPPSGCYIMIIINATVGEANNKNKDKMLRLELDIAEGEYKNYYTNYSTSINKNRLLKHCQFCENENSLPFFKKLITDIENSNLGYKFDFNCNSLRGRLVGAWLLYENFTTNDGQDKEFMKVDKTLTVGEVRETLSEKLYPINKSNNDQNNWNNNELNNSQSNDLPFN